MKTLSGLMIRFSALLERCKRRNDDRSRKSETVSANKSWQTADRQSKTTGITWTMAAIACRSADGVASHEIGSSSTRAILVKE
eukprot:3359516-Amphidinium_carterae.1